VCGSVRHCYVGFVEHGEHSEDERDHFLHFIEPFSKTKETGWLWSTQFRQENLENQFVGSATYPAIIKIDMAERMFSILSGKSDLTQAKMSEFIQKKGNQTFYQIPDILTDQMMIDEHIETRDFIEMELPQDEDEEEEFEKLLIDHDEL